MKEMKHGGNVWEGGRPAQWLDFSANLRPEGTPEWVRHVMLDALADTRYYPDRALSAARAGLAAYAGVPETCVLPTAGGAAAIDLTLQMRRGRVYSSRYTFGEYAERAAVRGREYGVWEGVCRAADTVILPNPNNPTGESFNRDACLQMHRDILAQGGELIVDEAFIDYCPQNSVRTELRPGLTVVGSLTKILCIPGVRLGYICAEPEVIRSLAQRDLPWAMNALASAVAAQLPAHLHEIERDAALNQTRRAAFARQLETLGAAVHPSESNFLLVDFHRDMQNAVAALKARGILVRTCGSFGLPGNYLRLAVKTEADNHRLIQALEEILHAR